jgi:hypothetical protein
MFKTIFANLDWRHWVLTHLVWIVGASVALVMGHSFIAEHDARILADAQVKTSERSVADLTKQIASTNTAAADKVRTVVKIVHDAQTPAQQIAAVPQLTDIPLNARSIPPLAASGPPQVAVDLAPLVEELGKCRESSVELAACQANLQAEASIVGQKQTEISALKKKPTFWARVSGIAKAVGIGIGIGILIGGRL